MESNKKSKGILRRAVDSSGLLKSVFSIKVININIYKKISTRFVFSTIVLFFMIAIIVIVNYLYTKKYSINFSDNIESVRQLSQESLKQYSYKIAREKNINQQDYEDFRSCIGYFIWDASTPPVDKIHNMCLEHVQTDDYVKTYRYINKSIFMPEFQEDGSYYPLVKFIKQEMLNSDKFQHIKTIYSFSENTDIHYMKIKTFYKGSYKNDEVKFYMAMANIDEKKKDVFDLKIREITESENALFNTVSMSK